MKITVAAVRILCGTLALAWSVSALAGTPLCRDVFSSDLKFRLMDDEVTPKQVATFRVVIENLNSHLGNLKAPQNVTIFLHKEFMAPRSSQLGKTVEIGVRFTRYVEKKIYRKSPSHSLAILAHEYGHLIFTENYILREPLYAQGVESLNKVKALNEKIQELKSQKSDLESKIRTLQADGQAVPGEYSQRVISLGTALGKIKAQMNDLTQGYNLITAVKLPFDELFADIVAVLYTGKHESISAALATTRKFQEPKLQEEARQVFEQRNFENRRDQNINTEDHNYFSAVRNAIWESYLESPSYRKNKRAEILEAVFEAIAKEISFKVNHKEILFAQNWKMLNDRLIEAIDKEMAARGIEKLK